MDPRLLRYYNRELQHLREMGVEFAKEFPKIASRLSLEGFECSDPYVERLLEGFAFLAGRVQLRIDAEFPQFTQHLLEMVYPHYLAPTPSMAMVQFRPELAEGVLAAGYKVPRGTILRSFAGKGEQTPCEYRTAHDVTLWPVEIREAEYFSAGREAAVLDRLDIRGAKNAIRLRLRTTAGMDFKATALSRLPIFLAGSGDLPAHLFQQIVVDTIAILVRPAAYPAPWTEVLPASAIRRVGFGDEEALLPCGPRSFQGYRLLHEYFAFPERYRIVEIGNLTTAVSRAATKELDVIFLLRRTDPELEGAVEASHFQLFCTPAVNLFPRPIDRIHLSDQRWEHHVVPDRTRPVDFEVYEISRLVGHGTSPEDEQEFNPFYSCHDMTPAHHRGTYYTMRRAPRMLSVKQRKYGPRSSYIGSEVFVTLVDADCAPYRTDLRQLAPEALCTNRDLPLQMPVGQGATDFNLQAAAPVSSVRCVAGPTKPRASWAEGDPSWRLISHLALNYLSLTDIEKKGAAAFRELLTLYAPVDDSTTAKQIDALRSVTSRPVIRRLPISGPSSFARGLEITVTFDEGEFGGPGFVLLGAVIERFFAKYVSINSFTETAVGTLDRGEVIRWPLRAGQRHQA
jgi:type VI secretion system protein ImpG